MLTLLLRTAACAALAAVLAVPPAAAGRDEPPEPPSRRELVTSQNNLKQIGLAFHNAHSVDDKLPGDIRDKDGKPLLSWRVAILPYLEEDALYKQFALDEAWDSDTNKKLIEKLPKVYAPIRVRAKAGETFYQAFAGGDTLFPEKDAPRRFANVTDGLSNTALVVEGGEPVVWSKPGGLPFDPKKPLPKLGGMFDGAFHVLLGDGSVRRVRKDFDADEMKKLITPAGGEVVDFDKLSK